MYDALQELSELSLELHKRECNIMMSHKAISRQIRVFEAMSTRPGRHSQQIPEWGRGGLVLWKVRSAGMPNRATQHAMSARATSADVVDGRGTASGHLVVLSTLHAMSARATSADVVDGRGTASGHLVVLSTLHIDVRCWTEWFDGDDPSGTGDQETLNNLREENLGKICPDPQGIEVMTTSGIISWTEWFDRDNPSATGDWENTINLKKEYPGVICEIPVYVEAVTIDTMTPAMATGQNIFITPNHTEEQLGQSRRPPPSTRTIGRSGLCCSCISPHSHMKHATNATNATSDDNPAPAPSTASPPPLIQEQTSSSTRQPR
ncbi:unnamed protein product [Merluccius merluccius]